MWLANSAPYSNSNSSEPLLSVGSTVTYPFLEALRSMSAPNSSSTSTPAEAAGTPRLECLPEAVVDHLFAIGYRFALIRGQRGIEMEHPGHVR